LFDNLVSHPEQLEQVEVVMLERMLVATWESASDLVLGMASVAGTYVYRLSRVAAVVAMGVLVMQVILALKYWRTHTRLVRLSRRVVTNVKTRIDEPLRR
jgi:uncharacterized membrane protein YciS (DUF1049 family)